MVMYMYSDLESQTRKQLLALIDCYNLGTISKYAKKSVLIDFILEKLYVDEDVVEEEPLGSVRIERIRRASNERN